MTKAEAGRLGRQKADEKLIARYAKRHLELVTDYTPHKCLKCGTPIPFEKKENTFCDHACSASFNNLGVTRNKIKKTDPNPERKCLSCGKKCGG